MEKKKYGVVFFDFDPITCNKTFLGIDSIHDEFSQAECRLEEILDKYDSPELSVEIFSSVSIDSFKENGEF